MSLGRLLSSGRTLVGLSGESGRYEMRRKALLPRFGSQANPFSTTRPEPLNAVCSEKIQTTPRTYVPAAAESQFETQQESQGVQPAAAVETVAVREGPITRKLELSKKPSGALRLLKRANPISWFRKQRPTAAGRVPAAAAPGPIQGELSLENVKVVRNDLNEAEMEMMQARIVSTPEPPAVSAPVEETPELIKT